MQRQCVFANKKLKMKQSSQADLNISHSILDIAFLQVLEPEKPPLVQVVSTSKTTEPKLTPETEMISEPQPTAEPQPTVGSQTQNLSSLEIGHGAHDNPANEWTPSESENHFEGSENPVTDHLELGTMAKIYKCKNCSLKFARHQTAKNHCRKLLWTCERCGKQIKQANNISRHRKRCEMLAQKQQNLDESIQPAVPDSTCSICRKVFKNKATVRSHMHKVHKENKEGQYECSLCDFKCKKEGFLKKHKKMKHEPSTRFMCNKCDFSCLSENGLRRHFILVHEVCSSNESDVESTNESGEVESDNLTGNSDSVINGGSLGLVDILTFGNSVGPGMSSNPEVTAGAGLTAGPEVSEGPGATDYSPVSVGAQMVPGASGYFPVTVGAQMGLVASSYSPVTVGAQMAPGASIYSPVTVGFQMRSSGASGYSPVTVRAQMSPGASGYSPVTVGALLPTAVSLSSEFIMDLGIPANTEAFGKYANSVNTEKELRFTDL